MIIFYEWYLCWYFKYIEDWCFIHCSCALKNFCIIFLRWFCTTFDFRKNWTSIAFPVLFNSSQTWKVCFSIFENLLVYVLLNTSPFVTRSFGISHEEFYQEFWWSSFLWPIAGWAFVSMDTKNYQLILHHVLLVHLIQF